MDHVDIAIIGAGVVGLAIAERLSVNGRRIVVVERHDAFGRETSSRNSEVIHAGLYYPPGSLKAKLCVEGNRLMYEFCEENGVPYKRCGKLVVARTLAEEAKIRHLFGQGTANGVEGLEIADGGRMRGLEPHCAGLWALVSPSTGIFDTHTLMKRLEARACDKGAIFAYNCEALAVSRKSGRYEVAVKDVDSEEVTLRCATLINAAGLAADRVAAMAGIDPDAAGYRTHFCKGEYFGVSNRHRGRLSHLVYPAPTPISLGVHGVLSLDGACKLGPSAFYVDAIDYSVDPAHKDAFYANAKTLFPFLEPDDLFPDMAGIRPKLQSEGEGFRDFVIRDEADKGLPGFINCIGIESPGLTSALAIARHIEKLLHEY